MSKYTRPPIYGSSSLVLTEDDEYWMKLYLEKMRPIADEKNEEHSEFMFLKYNGSKHESGDISFSPKLFV